MEMTPYEFANLALQALNTFIALIGLIIIIDDHTDENRR